jgi:ATP-dependent Lon protease
MKESAKLAISYIRAHAKSLGVDPDFYKNKDIHLHVPEGAVPKDGPSAGVAILCAITSALSGRPVRSDISMTGELTLTGSVLPIGGLKEKTSAAYAAGVRRILIPKDNEADLEKIDGVVRDGAQFILMSSASDALREVFAQRSRPLLMHIPTPELPRTQALADDIPSAPVRAPYKNA